MTASEKMVDIIRGIQNGRQGHAGHLVYVPSIMNKKQIDDILTAYEAEKDEKESIIESLESEIARLESEKSLLEKTRAWHQHGAVAPSCVGCPTAEAEIASGKYTRVITKRLVDFITKSTMVLFPTEPEKRFDFMCDTRAYLTAAEEVEG